MSEPLTQAAFITRKMVEDNTRPVMFASAYRQLTPAQRAFVDAATSEIDNAAQRANERISLALNRPIPEKVVAKSHGMLENSIVCAAITERINEIAAAQELTAQRLVKELMSISTSNVGDYLTWDDEGNPSFDLNGCTPEQMAAIKTIEISRSGHELGPQNTKIKVQFHDKLASIKMLGEYIGLWSGDNPHYRAEQAKAMDTSALPADTTAEQAADTYQSYLGNS